MFLDPILSTCERVEFDCESLWPTEADTYSWYDGPLIFSIFDRSGARYWVHWLDEENNLSDWVVAPIKGGVLARVLGNDVDLIDLWKTPDLRVVRTDGYSVVSCWRVGFDQIPPEVKPRQGIRLRRVRESGEGG